MVRSSWLVDNMDTGQTVVPRSEQGFSDSRGKELFQFGWGLF